MYINIDDYDIDSMRSDLIDYFGSATPINQLAYSEVIVIENADDEDIIKIAYANGFNLDKYLTNKYER